MVQRLLFSFLLLVALQGCSSVQTVSTSGETRTSYAEVNQAVRGKVVRVQFKEGASIQVVGLQVAPDSLSWVDPQANALKRYPTADVREVSIVKAGRGALAGLLVGAVLGAGVGAARAVMQGDDPPEDPIGLTQEEKLQIFPVAHAVYASLVTVPIGAIVGGRHRFRFAPVTPLPTSE